jgi:adenylate cyclase, class 2
MRWEVEQKFRVNDVTNVRQRLVDAGASFTGQIEQVDRYFNHPSRDFAQTDEALRLRQVGEQNFITYKGPKIDPSTKTRRELEIPLPGGDQAHHDFVMLLDSLGFLEVGTVKKRRQLGELHWQGAIVEIAVDNVEGLGWFAEFEIAADDRSLAQAKVALDSLTRSLELGPSERRSYLELLIHKRA